MKSDVARYLRALMWLRWRMLMRSLSRGRGRDIVERFSLAAQTLVPIIAIILMVPAALGLGAVGFLAGFWAGQPAGATMLTVVHITLMFACGFTLFAPLVFPASSEASGQLRLLLLPIPRGVLYFLQMLGVLADPWLGILLPLFVGIPIGFALSGRPLGALVTLVCGIGMIAIVVGLAMLSASLLQLLLQKSQARRASHGRRDAGLHADIDVAVVSRAGLRRREGKTPIGTARPARTPGRRGSEHATTPARPVGGRAGAAARTIHGGGQGGVGWTGRSRSRLDRRPDAGDLRLARGRVAGLPAAHRDARDERPAADP